MDDLKLLGRNENYLKNEITIVQKNIIVTIIGHITQKSSENENFKTKYLGEYPQVRKMKSDIEDIEQSNEKLDRVVRTMSST